MDCQRRIEAAHRAIDVCDPAGARAGFLAAQATARALGDRTLEERAFCGLAFLEIESGRADGVLPELRRMLLCSGEPQVEFLAAYHIGRAFDLRRDFAKATFYAQTALGIAERAGDDAGASAALNLLGNCLLSRSRFPEALEHFAAALRRAHDVTEDWRLGILDGVGYCLHMLGRTQEAARLLYASLRRAARLGSRFAPGLRCSLAEVLLALDRPRLALRHAEIALRCARELGDSDGERLALVLVGSAASAAGASTRSHTAYAELGRRYYPDTPGLAACLAALGPAATMNLRG